MNQTIEIVRISSSTLNELRSRAGNNHLDDIILAALRAYDAGLEKERSVLEEVLEQTQASHSQEAPPAYPARPAESNTCQPDGMSEVMPEPLVDQALDIPQVLDIPPGPTQAVTPFEPHSPDSDIMDALICSTDLPDTSADHADISVGIVPDTGASEPRPETGSAAGGFEAEPRMIDDRRPATVEPALDSDGSHLPTRDEALEKPEPTGLTIPSDVEQGDTPVLIPEDESDAMSSGTNSETPSSVIVPDEDVIHLSVEAGNPELAYTMPEMGSVDGRIVHPTAWFNMLGEVVIRLGEITGRNAHDLVALINESDLGIRGRVGDVRILGFYPVRDAGLSIRKVSSGKTWSAIVKIANKFGMTVDVRLKWHDDKPGLHPGRYGLLHISAKNDSESRPVEISS